MTRSIIPLLALATVAAIGCTQADGGRQTLWTCAMHPQYVTDHPGNCPICGMTLVRKGEAAAAPAPGQSGSAGPAGVTAVTLDPAQQRLLGLKSVEVRRGELAGSIRAVGRVAFDERRRVVVTARFDGFIEKLQADFTGKAVKKGDPLLSIYSPELLATQQEYLLAKKSQATLAQSGLPGAGDSARDRLRLYGISDAELDRVAERGVPLRALTLHAPASGVVTVKNAVAGARVTPEAPLFEIVDLSHLWVLADVYEYELPRLQLGQRATLTVSYWPDKSWVGRVSYIFPSVDDKTRTVKVRVELDNPRLELKPEMFGDVVIEGAAKPALLVAADAVIESGTRKLVFVVRDKGRLEPREITVGLRAGGELEVLHGLAEGDRVASGASFLLDSEAQLKAAAAAMQPAASIDEVLEQRSRP